jgi:hypothetical protein
MRPRQKGRRVHPVTTPFGPPFTNVLKVTYTPLSQQPYSDPTTSVTYLILNVTVHFWVLILLELSVALDNTSTLLFLKCLWHRGTPLTTRPSPGFCPQLVSYILFICHLDQQFPNALSLTQVTSGFHLGHPQAYKDFFKLCMPETVYTTAHFRSLQMLLSPQVLLSPCHIQQSLNPITGYLCHLFHMCGSYSSKKLSGNNGRAQVNLGKLPENDRLWELCY